MKLPKLSPIAATRETVGAFVGLDRRTVIPDGAWADMENVITDKYPTAAVRGAHGGVGLLGSGAVTGLFQANGHVAYTRGTKAYIYTGGLADYGYVGYDLGLDALSIKDIISMGAYRIILPDWKYINLTNPVNDRGDVFARARYIHADEEDPGNATSMSVSPCDETGAALQMCEDPDNPSDGDYIINHTTLVTARYNATLGEWEVVDPTYLKVMFTMATGQTSPLTGVKYTDGEYIRFVSSHSAAGASINYGSLASGSYKYVTKGNDYVVIEAKPAQFFYLYFDARFEHNVPLCDYVFECENRLWGCRYGRNAYGAFVNEIYASALGDFTQWYKFEGTSMDAYTASVGTDGPFTGGIAYLGRPLFFKENVLHKVYGSYPAQYQIVSSEVKGVKDGCGASLATVGGTLYYISRSGVAAYDGSDVSEVGTALCAPYSKATAAGHKTKYFLMAEKEDDGTVDLLVYDTVRGTWVRDTATHPDTAPAAVGALQPVGDDVYFITVADAFATVRTYYGSGTADPTPVTWYAETGDLGLTASRKYASRVTVRLTASRKYASRVTVRMRMKVGSYVRILISYDDGEFEQIASLAGWSLDTFSVPVAIRRCDHYRLRLEGTGYAEIFSITKTIQGGSEIAEA